MNQYLDGLNTGTVDPDETLPKLKEALDKGVRIAISTGRVYPTIEIYSKLLGINVDVICSNGAYIKERDSGDVVLQSTLGEKLFNKIYELIKRTRENDYFSFQELLNIFNNKLISSAKEINSSDAYETLLSKFMECIIKMPLDETLKNHTLINYIYSSIKKCKIRAIYETHN